MSTDAIVVLKDDHRELRRAFREYATTSATDTARRGAVISGVLDLLTVHTHVEEQVLYPRVRDLVPELDHSIAKAQEEHHVAEVLAGELARMEPYEREFAAKAEVLIDTLRHHMDEAEHEWFPIVRRNVGRKQLQEIGRDVLRAKDEAATSAPHGSGGVLEAVKAVFD